MTDYKALCADIVRASDAVEHDAAAAEGDFLAAVDNARIALAQPEPEERPIWTEGICGDGAAILKDGVMQPIESVIAALNAAELAQPESEDPIAEFVSQCRPLDDETLALLTPEARWRLYDESRGTQPESEGEAGELVEDLRECADSCTLAEKHGWARVMRRAAELLTRYTRPNIKPVPVAERLPGPEDCNARGWCWYWHPGEECWEMVPVVTGTLDEWTHWLPHHALPVPGAEAGQ
jgi:hypothetical protein